MWCTHCLLKSNMQSWHLLINYVFKRFQNKNVNFTNVLINDQSQLIYFQILVICSSVQTEAVLIFCREGPVFFNQTLSEGVFTPTVQGSWFDWVRIFFQIHLVWFTFTLQTTKPPGQHQTLSVHLGLYCSNWAWPWSTKALGKRKLCSILALTKNRM